MDNNSTRKITVHLELAGIRYTSTMQRGDLLSPRDGHHASAPRMLSRWDIEPERHWRDVKPPTENVGSS
jgi:hypothetical protein